MEIIYLCFILNVLWNFQNSKKQQREPKAQNSFLCTFLLQHGFSTPTLQRPLSSVSTNGNCMIRIICDIEQMYQVDKPHLELVHRIELNSDFLCALNDSLISTSQSLKDTFWITKVAVVYTDFIYFSWVKSVKASSSIKQLLRMTCCSF